MGFEFAELFPVGAVIKEDANDSGLEILGKLGEGKFGAVFKAVDKKTNSECALKAISIDEDLATARREVSTLYILTGKPHIVQMVKNFETTIEDVSFMIIALELMDGDLATQVAARRLNQQNSLKILYDLTKVCEILEKAGLVHQDIHGGNIMFCGNFSTVKLGDFGLSNTRRRVAFEYSFDSMMLLYTVMTARSDSKTITYPEEGGKAPNIAELKSLRQGLGPANMFLESYLTSLIEEMAKEHISYPVLFQAIRHGFSTFSPRYPFEVSTTSPPHLL